MTLFFFLVFLVDSETVQSPIAISISSRETSIDDHAKPFTFHGHWDKEGTAVNF